MTLDALGPRKIACLRFTWRAGGAAGSRQTGPQCAEHSSMPKPEQALFARFSLNIRRMVQHAAAHCTGLSCNRLCECMLATRQTISTAYPNAYADERAAIERVMRAADCPRSPITGVALQATRLLPNRCGVQLGGRSCAARHRCSAQALGLPGADPFACLYDLINYVVSARMSVVDSCMLLAGSGWPWTSCGSWGCTWAAAQQQARKLTGEVGNGTSWAESLKTAVPSGTAVQSSVRLCIN